MPRQLELHRVRVLVFVYRDMAPAALEKLACFARALKEFKRLQEEVVEIERRGLRQLLLILFPRSRDGALTEVPGARRVRRVPGAAPLRPRYGRKDGVGVLILHARGFQRALHGSGLVVPVPDGEARGHADLPAELPKDADAQGVEG